ncbi:MAG: hypothetical protein ACPG5T_05485 [Endozoicomonas sp.]
MPIRNNHGHRPQLQKDVRLQKNLRQQEKLKAAEEKNQYKPEFQRHVREAKAAKTDGMKNAGHPGDSGKKNLEDRSITAWLSKVFHKIFG